MQTSKLHKGFGSNQVATILGLGMFFSFYAWMNKLLFSGLHVLDGFFFYWFICLSGFSYIFKRRNDYRPCRNPFLLLDLSKF